MRNIFLPSLLAICIVACNQPSKPSENKEADNGAAIPNEIKTGGIKMI